MLTHQWEGNNNSNFLITFNYSKYTPHVGKHCNRPRQIILERNMSHYAHLNPLQPSNPVYLHLYTLSHAFDAKQGFTDSAKAQTRTQLCVIVQREIQCTGRVFHRVTAVFASIHVYNDTYHRGKRVIKDSTGNCPPTLSRFILQNFSVRYTMQFRSIWKSELLQYGINIIVLPD